ncbi:PREDICTED: E3 ubiquitin-protein ligase TM129-like isoform X2 [Priapulus caudatus]|uniref:E3 ubiquitin-protein ligase TM129-like isoform X2 n=1 Tax=Priapulus caudatus TaxID=37621 RepID=A0ABM1E1X1_PRICU|nr:PREDICTED: E3 ubiquitin-protein ligase TM129-like isoform X2 [Priapulus caudatus]
MFCYYIGLGYTSPGLQLFNLGKTSYLWIGFLCCSLLIVLVATLTVLYWYKNNWSKHPISKTLERHGNRWYAVASDINIEYRRITKFTSILGQTKVYITDSWIVKVSTYNMDIAYQSDVHLTLHDTDSHAISHENMGPVQYVSITVSSIRDGVHPFSIRLNSNDYNDLQTKIQAPIRNARNIVIHQSLSDKFLDAFQNQVALNEKYSVPADMELEQCIGCMQTTSDVKLTKRCDDATSGDCVQCYCRPMWCRQCMGKWFASRQDQERPETWLASRSPCPTCRSTFCMLDVCRIVVAE